jgi:integrase
MPAQERNKTDYVGVYFIWGTHRVTGKPEKIFYITYRKNGKLISEKAGRASEDMTPARASNKRALRLAGKEATNAEQRDAEKAAKAAEARKWTISKLWDEYKASRKPGKGLSTDTGRYEKYIEPAFSEKEPLEIVPLDVERIKRRLLKSKSPQTVKHILNLLTWIINFGVKKGLCSGLTFHVEKPKVDNIRTEDLTKAQLKRLLDAIEKDDHEQAGNMMLMALYSGLRRGEMFKLQWKHIDFEKNFISLVDPKGGKDEQIPLNSPTKKLLKSIQQKKGSPFVFPGRGGKQRTDINKALSEIKKKARLPKGFRALHGLRHVFASHLASSGKVDMYVLQRLLTHKDPRMTQRYSHLRDEVLKKASDVAADIVEQVAVT